MDRTDRTDRRSWGAAFDLGVGGEEAGDLGRVRGVEAEEVGLIGVRLAAVEVDLVGAFGPTDRLEEHPGEAGEGAQPRGFQGSGLIEGVDEELAEELGDVLVVEEKGIAAGAAARGEPPWLRLWARSSWRLGSWKRQKSLPGSGRAAQGRPARVVAVQQGSDMIRLQDQAFRRSGVQVFGVGCSVFFGAAGAARGGAAVGTPLHGSASSPYPFIMAGRRERIRRSGGRGKAKAKRKSDRQGKRSGKRRPDRPRPGEEAGVRWEPAPLDAHDHRLQRIISRPGAARRSGSGGHPACGC